MSERVSISQDERYPFFNISDKWGEDVGEVSAETLKRWREVLDAFEAIQDEMEAVFEEAKKRNAHHAAIAKAEKAAREAQERLDALLNEGAT